MRNPDSPISPLAAGALLAGVGCLLGSIPLTAAPDWPEADLEFFEREVRPILATRCSSCHGNANAMSGLRLDSRKSVTAGGNRGPAIVAGRPDDSLLIQAVRHESIKMPLGESLTDAQISALEEWVRRGAPWPPEAQQSGPTEVAARYDAMRREHWAFQPVRNPPIPEGAGGRDGEYPVDRFIQAGLQRAGLGPSPPAERGTLLRRLSLVLTGLPPTPRMLAEFADSSLPAAYSGIVDQLLDSPHFGEHWARHWMDVVRFGETLGNDWNYENNGTWLYRDYLIRALNDDVPYDQLIREHIAGDLLEEPRLDAQGKVNESLVGTFFFRLGEQGHDDCTMFRAVRTDVVDDQIDTLGKAFQGMTVSCARCHDHKLDPIPTADYYSIYGVLDSSRMVTRTVDTHQADRALKERMARAKDEIRREMARFWLREADDLKQHLLASLREHGPLSSPDDGSTVLDPERGERIRELADTAGPDLGSPLAPWAAIARDGRYSTESWERLADQYELRRHRHTEFNEDTFDVIADFRTGDLSGWHAEGLAFEAPTVSSGQFSISPGGDGVVSGIFPAGVYTHLLSEKLNGALRSPYLPRNRKYLSLRVVGGKLAAWRTVLDNCTLSENYRLIDQTEFGWIKIPLREEHSEYRIYAELVTKHDNPRLPDRPDRMKDISDRRMTDPRSFFGITHAVLHDCDEPPADELGHLTELFSPGPPASRADLADRYAAIARKAVESWRDGTATDDQARWLQWLLASGFLSNSKHLTPRLRQSVDLYRALERQLGVPRVIQGMADLENGRNARIFRAGNADDPGAEVPRGFLSLLGDDEPAVRPHGSGRRAMAELIASDRNPLTARVMVNRIWHHLFGRGIVATVDNLGRFGEMPSHPDLLDHLASRFMENGWSIKEAVRYVVMSRTFRQSSAARDEASESDPANELLHRYPARRLTAESIRDSMLVTSGTFDPTMFGPSIHPYREEPKPYRKLLSGPLDGHGRRSLYLKVTRHEGSSFLEAMDFPPPAAARGRRDVTNVPRQALTMMNDRFVTGEAESWARALVSESSASVEDRLRTMYRKALGRAPGEVELERMAALAEEFCTLHGERQEILLNSIPVWRDVAHAIFNLKEFTYVH